MDGHNDNKTWRGASDALKAESFGENDLLALARTMSMFISRLDPFHKEFQKSLRAKAIQREDVTSCDLLSSGTIGANNSE